MKKPYFYIFSIALFFAFFLLIYIYIFDTKENFRQFSSPNQIDTWTDYSKDRSYDTMILRGPISISSNSNGILAFYTCHQNITIYCNETLIYQFPVENNNPFALSPGYNWNFVFLPKGSNDFRIMITSPYDGYIESIPTFYVGNTISVIGRIISDNIGSFIICIIIFSIGVCMVTYWIYIRLHTPIKMNLLYLGVFALLLSVWSINESSFTILLLRNNLVCSYISFITLSLLPFSFALFVQAYYEDDEKIWDIFYIIDSIQIVLCLTLQVFKIADLRHTLWTTHVMMISLTIIIVFSSIKILRREERSKQVMVHLVCICICVTTLAIDFFAYFLGTLDNNNFGRIGFLFYLIVLGLTTFKDSASLMKLGQKANTLQHLAFTDQMTKLSNRTAFNQDFAILSALPEDIAIINLDLNNLKQINDTLGHNYGDKYIIGAATIISNTFATVGKCYRVGGDEFVVIIEHASEFDFPYYFNLMEWSVDSFNNRQNDIHIQIAYGFAIYDHSLDKNLDDTYSRADKNMYNNKKEKKRNRL